MKRVIVIGAGAAGCFAAIRLRRMRPDVAVTVLEAGPKALAKVAITGGGRCNLTNDFSAIGDLSEAYPRGAQLLRRGLCAFSQNDTVRWFEDAGVPLVLQPDHCWFPRSQDAMQIVDTLLRLMREHGVELLVNQKVTSLEALLWGYRVRTEKAEFSADAVLVTTGGSPRADGLGFLAPLALEMVPPVPSLFSFKLPDSPLRALMGTVVDEVGVAFAGTHLRARGTLLVTDWGVSGPAILRLSSYAARYLAEQDYRAELIVNWLPSSSETGLRVLLESYVAAVPQKQLSSLHPEGLTSRLWEWLLQHAGLRSDLRWGEIGRKGLNRLVAVLSADSYSVAGRNRFRDEFVTCGGVSLSNLDIKTLECKAHPGLFFAGEVLDIDGITGGFNLQAAWTCGWVAAGSVAAAISG